MIYFSLLSEQYVYLLQLKMKLVNVSKRPATLFLLLSLAFIFLLMIKLFEL